jgi:hypothetical protein
MQFYSLRTTGLLGMLLLASCTAQHSDEWHVGYCTAGVMSEMPSILDDAQIDRALRISAKRKWFKCRASSAGLSRF